MVLLAEMLVLTVQKGTGCAFVNNVSKFNQMRQTHYLYITSLQPSYFPLNFNETLQELLLMCHLFASAMH